jgi:hypothetical protein
MLNKYSTGWKANQKQTQTAVAEECPHTKTNFHQQGEDGYIEECVSCSAVIAEN